MAADPESNPASPLNFPRIRDANFREVYSNTTLTHLTPFDLTIVFGKLGDMGGQSVMIEQASVSMSPQHCKAFLRSLTETLIAYESMFGELQIPDSDTKPMFNADQIAERIAKSKEKAASANADVIAEKPQGGRGSRKAKIFKH